MMAVWSGSLACAKLLLLARESASAATLTGNLAYLDDKDSQVHSNTYSCVPYNKTCRHANVF